LLPDGIVIRITHLLAIERPSAIVVDTRTSVPENLGRFSRTGTVLPWHGAVRGRISLPTHLFTSSQHGLRLRVDKEKS